MSHIFFNGKIVPEHQACLSVMDRGLLYGDGFFETILSVNGNPEFLAEHVGRLDRSCRRLHINFDPNELDWNAAIGSLLKANGLSEGLAVIKIIVTRGVAGAGLNLTSETTPTLIITARPYLPPSLSQTGKGARLVVFPLPHSTPLAGHKSLNYLYYLMARQYALDKGADEAIIVDPQGNVLECAAANIFCRRGKTIIKPPSEAPYLQGIMEQKILPLLNQLGYTVQEEYFTADRLPEASEVFITNSLIRITPVAQVEGRPCQQDNRASRLLKQKLPVYSG